MAMRMQYGRHLADRPVELAEGWILERLTPASRLFGANGMSTGADGRIYVAQMVGSQISAVDIETGAVESISAKGDGIISPDDIAFDPAGNIYATEITEGRVGMRQPNGKTRVIYGDMPSANPITFHDGRLYAGEARHGGRIMELSLDGGAPRMLLEDVPIPNAFQVGPDGRLYFPVMAANEIWRVSLDGGAPEKIAGDLGMPDSVKFDSRGRIVSTQIQSGQVLRIDVQSGAQEVLADIGPGLDNCTFVGQRLFVSSISGQINEVLDGGQFRSVVPRSFNWPLDIAMSEDGMLTVADGLQCYHLRPGGSPTLAGMIFHPGYPGYCRGIAASGPGELVITTGFGQVTRWRPALQDSEVLAEGFERLYGVAIAPGGAIVFAEAGTGRVLSLQSGEVEVLATELKEPMGIAASTDGVCYVSESQGKRVVKLSRGQAESVIEGLQQPQGILVRDGALYVVDALAKELIEVDLNTGARRTIVANLPVGAPPGVSTLPVAGVPGFSGPMGPFAGITAGPDGTLYLSADAEGSVLALHRGS